VTGAVLVTGMVAEETMLVLLDGPRLLDPDGRVLAELAPDGHWYTAQGLRCQGLTVPPPPTATRRVAGAAQIDARRRTDALWMTEASEVITRLAERQQLFTSDEVWAALQMPPRESRMIGNAFTRARSAGVIAPSGEHRPSGRKENHGRPVRVWRSLRYGKPS
jgi:hypothetical protein